MKFTRPIILLVLQGTLLGIEVATSYDDRGRQIALAITNVASVIGIIWFDARLRRVGQQLSWLTILMALASVWIDALGNFQHLYARFWWYDRVTHTIGGMALSAVCIDLYQHWRRSGTFPMTPAFATWSGFLLGQFIGAMYEVSEWLGDWWFHTERVWSAFDAPRDLFFNLMGGLLIALLFRLTQRKK